MDAFDHPLVRSILPHYAAAARDIEPTYFQIAKRVKANKNPNLWEEHQRCMRAFYDLKEKMKAGLNLFDLDVQEFSLLDIKIAIADSMMEQCELCERRCRVNRKKGELGECRVGNRCLISSEFIHLGEEFHISPSHTIFFMGCNLHCQFCQNWSISQWYETGFEADPKTIAKAIEIRRSRGARNVNFVGGEPTPSLLWILRALKECSTNVPTIWNSNMYMSNECMLLLEGVVDMYLSDFKYGNDECSTRLSKVNNYFNVSARNHLIASETAELTVRHLILPNHVQCCSFPVLEWVAKHIKERCIVNIMDQYRPEWRAHQYEEIVRRINAEEFERVKAYASFLKLNYIM